MGLMAINPGREEDGERSNFKKGNGSLITLAFFFSFFSLIFGHIDPSVSHSSSTSEYSNLCIPSTPPSLHLLLGLFAYLARGTSSPKRKPDKEEVGRRLSDAGSTCAPLAADGAGDVASNKSKGS